MCYNAAMAFDLRGSRAFVTGASSGIGVSLAHQLAQLGAHVILVARRQDKLAEVATDIGKRHGTETTVVAADLGKPEQRQRAWAEATAGGPIDILINNAGFGHHRPFAAVAAQRDRDMLALNIDAVVELTHWFIDQVPSPAKAPGNQRGYILNVASVAAYQPVPNMATYAASKAFVHHWSSALHVELAPQHIAVCSLNPGGTHTDFHRVAGAGGYGKLADMSMLSADQVAAIGVRAMLRGQADVVPGLINKMTCFMVRLAPRSLAAKTAQWVMGRTKTDQLPPTAG